MNISRPRRLAMAAAGVVGAAALAACSSGSEASLGDGEVTQEVRDIVATSTEVPTSIVQTEPLSSVPEKKSVAFIVCADPTCEILGGFLEDAVSTFGWEFTAINAPATDFGSAVQQAIDLDVDYIAGTGSDIATFKTAFDAAEEAGIPYFSCYSSDVPAGPENNLYANCYDVTANDAYGKALTSWMIQDGDGSASIGVVSIPEFPTLAASAAAVHRYADELCEACAVKDLELTVDDLVSGGSPNAIVSFLQSNPDIEYLYLTFGNFEVGLGQALKSAGLDGVKVVGVQPQQPQVKSMISGDTDAWLATPQENAMWTLADQMARVATGDWNVEQERAATIPPVYILDSVEDAEAIEDLADGWPGPDGFKDQYKALWGVG
ncbi:sugar ABC transporter substrate-binding protein [Nocardioides caeni]|uniref:Sugar ABC transporter substrate-binding protein n=1 Tax=Nocardioides caeni TaxID=574700 RepID=A0A4S8NDY6_9ACTN|nr:substrate-binding domain-containing protein [Nocardioides caeni]THV14773.1 sugar ABC transporter substrate-binding protein [Nocardioides caeni]